MRANTLLILLCCTGLGCTEPAVQHSMENQHSPLETVAAADLAVWAKSINQPVIVEFSVLHGCQRCAEMRPEVRKLASEQTKTISIKRADFVKNQPFLQSLGASICPTYVLFTPGAKPLFHTSPDLLLALATQSTGGSND